jgi:transposase-like protein
MSSRRHTPEQIINTLRQAEVEIGNGATINQAAKKIGVTDHLLSVAVGVWWHEGGSGQAA